MARPNRPIALPSTYTYTVSRGEAGYTKVEGERNTYVNSAGHYASNGQITVLEFQFSEEVIDRFFRLENNPTIVAVGLEFWVYDQDLYDKLNSLDIAEESYQVSGVTSAQTIYQHVMGIPTGIESTSYVTTTVDATNRNLLRLTLGTGSSSAACQAAQAGIEQGWFCLAIRPVIEDQETGRLEIGGQYLHGRHDQYWEEMTETEYMSEPVSPPRLILFTDVNSLGNIEYDMRYTTSDPTSAQSRADNSIGGHMASNNVYEEACLGRALGADDTSVFIKKTHSLPSSTGLMQVGPEIMAYTSTDSDLHSIGSLTRGVSPGSQFPGRVGQSAERVRYLEIDQLFDKKPVEGYQYRCIAVVNSSSVGNHLSDSIPQNVKVSLLQATTSQVQTEIAIEVPRHDSHIGVLGDESFGDQFVDTSNFTEYTSGHFNGSYIKYGNELALIESFESSEYSSATFNLDRSLSITIGESFLVLPAPSQRVASGVVAPSASLSRFSGFSSSGWTVVDFIDHEESMWPNDVFYVWIKRILTANQEADDDTGAVIVIQYRDPNLGASV